MGIRGLSVLAVIPARGGSKGIPRKNLSIIAGKTLLAHAVGIAQGVQCIDRIVVSTDDPEIADEARLCGIEVPFTRPSELAADDSTTVSMWQHAWLASESYYEESFDISVLLEPTSPLRTITDVEKTVIAMLEGKHMAAATVSRTPAHFTPHKTLTIVDGKIDFFIPEGRRYSLRQSIPAYYHRNGACYVARKEQVINNGKIVESDCAAVVIDRPLVNIDDPLDLTLAETLASS